MENATKRSVALAYFIIICLVLSLVQINNHIEYELGEIKYRIEDTNSRVKDTNSRIDTYFGKLSTAVKANKDNIFEYKKSIDELSVLMTLQLQMVNKKLELIKIEPISGKDMIMIRDVVNSSSVRPVQ